MSVFVTITQSARRTMIYAGTPQNRQEEELGRIFR